MDTEQAHRNSELAAWKTATRIHEHNRQLFGVLIALLVVMALHAAIIFVLVVRHSIFVLPDRAPPKAAPAARALYSSCRYHPEPNQPAGSRTMSSTTPNLVGESDTQAAGRLSKFTPEQNGRPAQNAGRVESADATLPADDAAKSILRPVFFPAATSEGRNAAKSILRADRPDPAVITLTGFRARHARHDARTSCQPQRRVFPQVWGPVSARQPSTLSPAAAAAASHA